ncbi:GTPase-activating of the rho rac family (LRG1) [Fusarium napiforme]|uniref:GTPase-activating of the rho rac family (LRG1) n=1 Tax=Fusarium napiforme TaxID=42672 RepID=A0A8H5JY57_9HYPO|nr:GTPase-activating of the rho rac family (LRG1) [Fusarium napiforme]
MDPLSIATSVVGLTATCLSTCKKLHDLAGEYQDVPAVIAMICSESTIISIGLSELQMKILRRDDLAQAWASKTEIWTAFETALTGCMVLLSCLETESRSLRSQNPGIWSKIKFIWNQDRLKELLGALRGQQSSITLLLNLLELIQKDIRKYAPKIKAAASEAQSLRSCYPSVKMDSESIFDNDAASLSFFHHEAASGYAPSELNFVFDDQVINSQAYRRVFVKAQSESQPPHMEDAESDTGTVKEVDKYPVRSHKNVTSVERDLRQKVAADARPWFQSGNCIDLQVVQHVRFAGITTCYGCFRSIDKDHLQALGRTWHVGCFKCSDCEVPLQSAYHLSQDESGIFPKPLCVDDYIRRRDIQCSKCQYPIACKFPIMGGSYSEKEGEKGKWHTFCLELASWGLVLPLSANGRRYLASIHDQSLKQLSCFYQQLHDDRAKDIYLCGSRYMKEFRDILTVCLEASRGATIRQSDAQFAVILTKLSCLFRATWTATPDGTFSFDEGEVGAFTSLFLKHLEYYTLGGWDRSPEPVAQVISDLLKPLLRFCFHNLISSQKPSDTQAFGLTNWKVATTLCQKAMANRIGNA